MEEKPDSPTWKAHTASDGILPISGIAHVAVEVCACL
jgi:hypothetical protein